jgi:4-hydroxyproline epimerase
MRRQVRVVDSHTGGEPTRVVLEGGPDLGTGPLALRRALFTREHDRFRTAIVAEPRGHEAVVGALLVLPGEEACAAGVVFFDGAGTLGMCGHGTIGLVATLAHLGRMAPGRHRIDTPVGAVVATLRDDGRVTIANVPSFRHARDVRVDVPGYGAVKGDVAWGGNWFYLVREHGLPIGLEHREALTRFTSAVREALGAAAVTGDGGAAVDHVELFGPSDVADSRNFVLCPGGAYDRSPCGTGTSARMAQLHARGELALNADFVHESVIGTRFTGRLVGETEVGGRPAVIPEITGRAWITGMGQYLLDPTDPFPAGFSL